MLILLSFAKKRCVNCVWFVLFYRNVSFGRMILVFVGRETRNYRCDLLEAKWPILVLAFLGIMKRSGLTFAYEALLNKAPEHVAAVMTVSWLVKGFLAERMAVGSGRLTRHRHRRHCFYPPFTPDFHRKIKQCTRIIICLCDLETVRVHFAAVLVPCSSQLHGGEPYLGCNFTTADHYWLVTCAH